MADNAETFSGGCQCGAIRFRVTGPVRDVSICNCRMCQKATGGLFAAYATVPNAALHWTRGRPTYFASSDHVRRGFCPGCGTPLTWFWDKDVTALAVGAFDRAAELVPEIEHAPAQRHAFFAHIGDLKPRPLDETPEAAAALARLVSHQHPDHETEIWRQTGGDDV